MKIYKTSNGIIIEKNRKFYLCEEDWDVLINIPNLYKYVEEFTAGNISITNAEEIISQHLLPPVGKQEIWASGVTYFRSRVARMEESKDAGGGSFYDMVYSAKRPELFMKCPGYRAVGHNQEVRIRKDSNWNVPEPELTLVINSEAKIIGYTIGNDMSSRDIEGENPLYLPQAKCFNGSAAVGPCVYLSNDPLPKDTGILLEIIRDNSKIFEGRTDFSQMKRDVQEFVDYLYRELTFQFGCLVMTGTGIVPPDEFTLSYGDEIRITIDTIGTLNNKVSSK